MKLTVNYDLGAEIKALANACPVLVRRELSAVLLLIQARVEKRLVELTPRGVSAQGGLSGSIHGEVVPYGDGLAAVVGTPLEYGAVIELGRRPHKRMPPVDPIALWAVRKLGVEEKDADEVGLAIARKIAARGFKGTHMFKRTMKELKPWIMTQLHTVPERVNRRLLSGSI